jgi:hypothetical protein
MDYYDENEEVDLKYGESYHERTSRKRIKNRKNIKKKVTTNRIFWLVILFVSILCILIFLFKRILDNERYAYESMIQKMTEEQKILIKNNSLLEKEKNYYQNLSELYFDRINKNMDVDDILNQKYKIVAISYGSEQYDKQLEYNGKSALEIAKVNEFYGYKPKDIDHDFREKNKYILEKGRGNGYWLWKPYFLYKTLKEKLDYGDYLIYSDAAIMYVDLAQKLVDFLKEKKLDMYLHRLPHLERQYTKRDAFILLGVDQPFYAETGQFNAAFQIYRKTKFTEFFLEEYLYYAQDKRIITDDANELGVGNYDDFRDHRHDQSILSLLTKKYGQVNANKTNLDINLIKNYQEVMPTIFCHYRQRGVGSYEDLKEMCKDVRGNIA